MLAINDPKEVVVVVVALSRDVGRTGSSAWPEVDVRLVLIGRVDEDAASMVEVVEGLGVLTVDDRVITDVEVVEMLVVGEGVVVDVLVLVVGEAVTVGLTVTVAVELRTPLTG